MFTTGLSNDHFQDILKLHPAAIHDIMTLCNLIAIGSLYDGPERAQLVQGKDTALIKTAVDCRPIVTEHPCPQPTVLVHTSCCDGDD
jgi:hypothetical protein